TPITTDLIHVTPTQRPCDTPPPPPPLPHTTDDCTNSAQCSQTVSVVDTTAPVMDCTSSANKTVQLGSPWTFDLPTATDNSGTAIMSDLTTVTKTPDHLGNTFHPTRT